MKFEVKAWSAWLPVKPEGFNHQNIISSESPDASFIPAMQRRRLGLFDKATLSTANMVLNQSEIKDIQTVFASQHGELERTFRILKDITNNQPVSPTEFSTSVYNTNSGLFSILNNITNNSTSITASENTCIAAFIETFSLINQSNQPVLLTFSDITVPPIIKNHIKYDISFSISILTDKPNQNSNFVLSINENNKYSDTEKKHPVLTLLSSLANHDKKYTQNFYDKTYVIESFFNNRRK